MNIFYFLNWKINYLNVFFVNIFKYNIFYYIPAQNYAEEILAKKLRSSDDSVIQCLDWLPVTSNIAERLFSQTKHVFSQYRKRLLPRHLEMQLFLMINESF